MTNTRLMQLVFRIITVSALSNVSHSTDPRVEDSVGTSQEDCLQAFDPRLAEALGHLSSAEGAWQQALLGGGSSVALLRMPRSKGYISVRGLRRRMLAVCREREHTDSSRNVGAVLFFTAFVAINTTTNFTKIVVAINTNTLCVCVLLYLC